MRESLRPLPPASPPRLLPRRLRRARRAARSRSARSAAPPRLANPNLQPLDPPSAFLTEALAQGLVRFDAAGEIEPALAQSWIVSDDGLRYTFRLRRTAWAGGEPVTAEQVAARLRAALEPGEPQPAEAGARRDRRTSSR